MLLNHPCLPCTKPSQLLQDTVFGRLQSAYTKLPSHQGIALLHAA